MSIRQLLVLGVACATAGCTGATAERSGARHNGPKEPATPVAVVAGVRVPRLVVEQRLRVSLVAAGIAQSPPPGSRQYLEVRSDVVRSLVQDITVMIEARRLRLIPRRTPVLATVIDSPGLVQIAYQRLYAYAARGVPRPRDSRIVAAARIDEHELGTFLTASELKLYYRWQTERDRVASKWFEALFKHYAARTRYAAGWAPA
jgi:hypothetical protein